MLSGSRNDSNSVFPEVRIYAGPVRTMAYGIYTSAMKLQQLRFLLAVVENDLNITAAAEALFTSQPGVSKQIRLLEDELDLQILVRNGKRVEALTDAGRRVVEHASRILQETERIKSLADKRCEADHGMPGLKTSRTQPRLGTSD